MYNDIDKDVKEKLKVCNTKHIWCWRNKIWYIYYYIDLLYLGMCKKNNINLRYNIKNGKRKIQNKTNTNKEVILL